MASDPIGFERRLEALLRGSAVAVRLAERLAGYQVLTPNEFDVLLYPPDGEVLFISSEDFSTLFRCHPSGHTHPMATGYGRDHDNADQVATAVVDLIAEGRAMAST